MTTKECTRCHLVKPIDEFYPHKRNNSGRYSHCKDCCRSDNNIKYAKEGFTKARQESAFKSHLKRHYGITPEQYQELFDKQGGCCVVCGKHQTQLTQRLAVDHNHDTGEIRGLACTYCNHKIIGAHTDGDTLRRLADYVENGVGWYVPSKERKSDDNEALNA